MSTGSIRPSTCHQDQLSLTNPLVESCQFSATSPAFNLPHLYLAPPLRVTPFELSFTAIFGNRKLEYLAIVWRCLRDPTFGWISRRPTCDRRTDRQTDRHDDS